MGKQGPSLERALPVLRRDLETLLGWAADEFDAGARVVRLPEGQLPQVVEMLDAIRGAERVVGRLVRGPVWMDELIDGEREVVA